MTSYRRSAASALLPTALVPTAVCLVLLAALAGVASTFPGSDGTDGPVTRWCSPRCLG